MSLGYHTKRLLWTLRGSPMRWLRYWQAVLAKSGGRTSPQYVQLSDLVLSHCTTPDSDERILERIEKLRQVWPTPAEISVSWLQRVLPSARPIIAQRVGTVFEVRDGNGRVTALKAVFAGSTRVEVHIVGGAK